MRGSALLPLFIAAMTPLLFFTAIVVGIGFRSVAWQPPVLWQHLLGADSAPVIASDSSGAYVEGYNPSPIQGYLGIPFLNKYDPSGRVVWNRTLNEYNGELINQMSVGSDGIYLSGENFDNGIFLKYDLAGNKLWERDYSVGGNPIWGNAYGLSAVPQGVYVIGNSPLTQYDTRSVAWVREYDSAGNIAWTSEFSSDTIGSNHVYASASGVFIAYQARNQMENVGSFLDKYSLSGNQLWTRPVPEAGGISGDSTGVYLTGSSLYKYDFNGNLDWATQINPPDDSLLSDSSVSADPSGIYLIVYSVRNNLYLFKYDFGGKQTWNFELPPSIPGNAHSVSAGSGVVYVAGSVRSNGAMVERLSPDPSLVFFGLNPPWSFMLLGGLIGVSAISSITYRRLHRRRVRPLRVGLPQPTFPVTD